MTIIERKVELSNIIGLDGELDSSTTAYVRAELRKRIQEGQVRFILDLSGVPFLDSSGLSVLVNSLKAARERGGDIVLLKPSKQVKTLIELTRLHRVFTVFDNEDDAVSAHQG